MQLQDGHDRRKTHRSQTNLELAKTGRAQYVLAVNSRTLKSLQVRLPAATAITGRGAEMRKQVQALASAEAEFVAIYGRRRVGKTFLVREFTG